MIDLTAAEARRIALRAQGFGERRPRPVTLRRVRETLRRLGLIQIDSVNVLARAHTVPLYSRHGPYDPGLLDRVAFERRGAFEYWGHEASYVDVDLHPHLRWRMERARRGEGVYGSLARLAAERPELIERVRREVEARGPLSAREIEEGGGGAGSWWGWSEAKRALEHLFWAGEVTTRHRRGTFERVYDLTERVLPREILDRPTPPVDAAQRELIARAAAALGVATEGDLRDYFRLGPAEARARVAELVEEGRLLPARVEGWDRPAYLDPGAGPPRRLRGAALVSPFDPLVWERSRAERIFGFRYRIEIYTPAHKRTHGYYVLPFLHGERIAARLDLKADRPTRRLLVLAAHREPGAPEAATAAALKEELELTALWLGLDRVEVSGRGDLAPALKAEGLPGEG